MPKELEKQLLKTARKKFPGDVKRQEHYVGGALTNYEKKKHHRKKRGRKK